MFNIVKKSIEWGHDTLTLETGRIARQADAAVVATYGETSVLATVVYEKSAKAGQDFFPLTVHYQEKTYAAGKIPGGFFKREARPSEKEVLTSRLIDRPIRPALRRGLPERGPGHRHRPLLRHGERPRHRRHDRRLGRAHAVGRAVHGPDRRGAGRLRRGRLRAEPGRRRHGEAARQPRAAPRPDRRRHQGRGHDGRVRGLRALRGRDARRGQVRPRADAAGDRPDHRHGRGRREGAVRLRRRGHGRALRARQGRRRRGDARGLRHRQQARAPGRRRRGEGHDPRRAERGGAGRPGARLGDQEARIRRRARGHPRPRPPHRRP